MKINYTTQPEKAYEKPGEWGTIQYTSVSYEMPIQNAFVKKEESKFELKRNLSDPDEIAAYIIAWSKRPIEDILTDLEESREISAVSIEQEEILLEESDYNGLVAGDITGSDIDHPDGGENRYVVEKNDYHYTYLPEYGIVFIEEALD